MAPVAIAFGSADGPHLVKWFTKRRRHSADGFLIENEHRQDGSQNTRVSTAFEPFFVLNTLNTPEDSEDETRGVPSFRLALNNIRIRYIYLVI